MKKSLLFLIFCAVGFSVFASPVWENPTCVRRGVAINWNGSCANTEDGNTIYVWSDTRAGTRDIYAQKFNFQGTPLWAEPVVIDSRMGLQENPQILQTSANDFVIAWYDFPTNGNLQIYAQKINQEGITQWQAGGNLICTSPFPLSEIQLATGTEGSSYVLWVDERNSHKDIFGQHLASNGSLLWPENGRQLTQTPGDETNPIGLNDTNGGLLLGYRQDISGHRKSFLMRYTDSGVSFWTEPVQIQAGTEQVYLTSLFQYNDNSFVYAWTFMDTSGMTNIAAQRIDSSGNLLWTSPAIMLTTGSNPGNLPQGVKTSEGKIIVSWLSPFNSENHAHVLAQKLTDAGVPLWQQNGVPISSDHAISSYKIKGDMDGGICLVWQNETTHEPGNSNIIFQRINPNGEILFGDTGILVSEQAKWQTTMMINCSNDHTVISWGGERNGNEGIYSQVFTHGGESLLEANGKAVKTGIARSIDYESIQVLHRSNDTVVIWKDHRFGERTRIYYQIVNPDGTALLEENGRLLTSLDQPFQKNFSAVVNSNDQVAIVWEEYTHDEEQYIYGQLIGVDGNKLWGENGLMISGASLQNSMPSISFEEGAFYVIWLRMNMTDYFNDLMGQKIVEGQLQWGENGIHISNPDLVQAVVENPTLSGRYFVWGESSESSRIVLVKRVTPDGLPAEGWAEYGNRVDENPALSPYEVLPVVNSNEQGAFITWTDLRNNNCEKIYAQHVSPQGQLLWDVNGVQIGDVNVGERKSIFGDHGLLMLWKNQEATPFEIYSTKCDFTGEQLWTNPFTLDAINTNNNYHDFDGCQFENGSYLIASVVDCEQHTQLKYRYIDQNGLLLGMAQGTLLSHLTGFASRPSFASAGNAAYIAWAEYAWNEYYLYNYDWQDDLRGLFLQRMNNETTANQDPVSSIASMSLYQNYPNPFNPETIIKYSLASQSTVKLEIYNIKGQKVKTLVNQKQPRGCFSVKWNGKDDADVPVATGMYFYRLSTDQKTITRKMALIK